MIWFLLGAAISLGAFDWSGGGGSRRFWAATLAALAAFGLALTLPAPGAGGECGAPAGLVCRAGFVVFAGLFLLSSLLFGLGSVFRRLSGASFAIFALSDLALVFAVWTHVGESSVWTLPAAGNWGAASGLGALAALLRLAAPLAASGERGLRVPEEPEGAPGLPARVFRRRGDLPGGPLSEAALLSVGWWQGALLAWWVGAGGGALLALGGLALWPAASLVGRPRLASLCAAGGLLSLAAVAEVAPAGLAGMGLAGVAMALGAHVVGVFFLAVLPFSVLTLAELPMGTRSPIAADNDIRAGLRFALAAIFPAAWSLIGSRLPLPSPAGRGSAGTVALSGALLASTAALAAAVAGNPQYVWVGWALAGVAAAYAASFKMSGRPLQAARPPVFAGVAEPGEGNSGPDGPPPSPRRASLGEISPALPGWALFCLTGIVFGRLVLTGLQTGFL